MTCAILYSGVGFVSENDALITFVFAEAQIARRHVTVEHDGP